MDRFKENLWSFYVVLFFFFFYIVIRFIWLVFFVLSIIENVQVLLTKLLLISVKEISINIIRKACNVFSDKFYC